MKGEAEVIITRREADFGLSVVPRVVRELCSGVTVGGHEGTTVTHYL